MTEFLWGIILGLGIAAALAVFAYILFMLAWLRNGGMGR